MSNTLLYAALSCASIAFILVIVSWSTYCLDDDFPKVDTNIKYFWAKSKVSVGGNSKDFEYGDLSKETKKIFNTSLTFLTIGGAVLIGFIVLVLLRLFVWKKSGLLRILGAITAWASTILLSVSFFAFLGITKAFDKDTPICGNPCDKFIGSKDNEKWGPGVGWWCLLGAIILASIAAVNALRKVKA